MPADQSPSPVPSSPRPHTGDSTIHCLPGQGRHRELESPSLGPLPPGPGHLAWALSLSPETSRHKQAPPGQDLPAGKCQAPRVRAWELGGQGSPPRAWGLDTCFGPEEGLDLELQLGPSQNHTFPGTRDRESKVCSLPLPAVWAMTVGLSKASPTKPAPGSPGLPTRPAWLRLGVRQEALPPGLPGPLGGQGHSPAPPPQSP